MKRIILTTLIALTIFVLAVFALMRITAKKYFERGNTNYSDLNYDSAIDDYTRAIRINSRHGEAYFKRGNVYFDKGDYDSAIADYTQAIGLNQKHIDEYNRQAYENAIKSFFRYPSIEVYPKAVQLDLYYVEAFFNRGNAYFNKGDYNSALADYAQVIRIEPNFAEVYNSCGLVYIKIVDYDRTIAHFKSVIYIELDSTDANNNRDNEAEEFYSLIVQLTQDFAIYNYTQAIRLNPNYEEAFFNRGNAYFNKDERKSAIADYASVIRLNPNHEEAKRKLEIMGAR